MDRRITTAISIMRENTGTKLSVRELARRVNLSVWHFTRLFKADTSVSPVHYMRGIRMKAAQGLLGQSYLSVKGSDLAILVDMLGGIEVYFLGTNSHGYELSWNGGTNWSNADVTVVSGASTTAKSGSPMTSFIGP